MALAVVTVASGGLPVVEVTAYGLAVTEAANARGIAVTKVVGKPGLPVTFVSATGGVTATTWNPADMSSAGAYTFSNGNLTVNVATGGNQGVRGTASKAAGKYYFEVTILGGTNGIIGIITGSASLSTYAGNSVGGLAFFPSGPLWYNGANTGLTLGAVSIGQVVCCAIDLTNLRAWVRINAGNWNGGAPNDPATNVGGINISSLFTSTPAFPVFATGGGPSGGTLNAGATAFAQTVPAGFTAWG
jgi:hypothetical protein